VVAIERYDFFAIPAWRGEVEGFSTERDGLLELARRERRASEGLRVSNQGGFRSHDALHEVDAPSARFFARAVLEFGVRALRDVVGGFSGRDLALTSSWANIDGPGTWHTPHCHYPAQWSGVLYVATDGCASDDPQIRAGKIELLSPLPAPQAFLQPTGVTFTPKDGMILLFPGVLQHLVHPHQSPTERVSIAFNVDVVPRR
jgi:uncharacterized protein (TIGR02466 family)